METGLTGLTSDNTYVHIQPEETTFIRECKRGESAVVKQNATRYTYPTLIGSNCGDSCIKDAILLGVFQGRKSNLRSMFPTHITSNPLLFFLHLE